MTLTSYRIYGNGIEFGIDFLSLPAAQAVKAQYAALFPGVRYYIRKGGN